MKKTAFLSALAVSLTLQGHSSPGNQKLNIEHATVFLHGAELESTAHLSFSKGENEIQFSNVAGDVNDQSIVVNCSNGVVVESVTFQNNFLATDNVSPRAKQIKDSIEQLELDRQKTNTRLEIYNEDITVLQANRKVSGDNTGLSVAELQKMLDLVTTKMEAYLNGKNKEEAELKKTDEHLARLKKQLDEEQKKTYEPGGQLLVKFYAKEATSSNITVSYVVNQAGWSPTYDVWAADAHSPLKLSYKANIFQNSGVKWDNVHLSISTGNPQEGMEAPELAPWYLAFYVPPPRPVYRNTTKMKSMNAPMAAARPRENTYIVDGVQTSGITDYVSVDNSGVNTSFDIDLPYTIPTDGQQHLVAVKQYETPAAYSYVATPKQDKDAFLVAKIGNWADLNLLSGPTNIFYEGTYVGHGYISTANIKDSIEVSLGRDKKIVLKRTRDTKLRSVKTIGTNVTETFAYDITIRNTRKEPITIEVQDQLPVSNDKDIVLDDKNTGSADYNETTGNLKWTVTLGANETKTLPFGYSVKYPRGKTIQNLN